MALAPPETRSSAALTAETRSPAALGAALVASVVVHGAVVLALLGLVTGGPRAAQAEVSRLAVRLVDPPPPSLPVPPAPPVQAPLPVAVAAVKPAEAARPRPPAPAPATRSEAVPAPAVEPAAPTPPVVATDNPLPVGRVDVAANYGIMSGLSQDLLMRTQGTYMREVERPVEILQKPAVTYPPDALAEGRDGSVVAWLAIAPDGSIEDVVIDSGEQPFVDAVNAVVASTTFKPAIERGERIPFWVVMTFDFHSGAASVAVDTPPR